MACRVAVQLRRVYRYFAPLAPCPNIKGASMATAVLSVYDKNGLVALAKGLKEMGWKLLATGGTLKAIRDAGLDAQEVAGHTGAPECFDGRVKTLHPRIHGGLLFNRELPEHVEDAKRLDIEAIDLVVVNLYPFEATIANKDASFEDCIEQIDIGGPSMIRSAAKNHASVTVLVDPSQYGPFLEKVKDGSWSKADRRACALEAYKRTSAYDAAISSWLEAQAGEKVSGLPKQVSVNLSVKQDLRYGENPHQAAGFYVMRGTPSEGIAACEQIQGKELSFNNLLDADGAARVVWQLEEPGCVIVKHNNPCGIGLGSDPLEAFLKALTSDPISAFGGIVAFNRPIGPQVAAEMAKTFWEVILAPGFEEGALEALAAKKQLRLLKTQQRWPSCAGGIDLRSIGGGFLMQGPDDAFVPVSQWETKATGNSPKPPDRDLMLAQIAAKALKSNSIALVKDGGTVGVGAGQMSRVDSVEIACRKAGEKALGAILGSDAFFPFADGLELAAKNGVAAFIEPGGSVRDGEVIEAASRLGVWLFFTGMRHFRH
ncbi:MAG: bifunctional phosphoribosylaminoimidazolecarboxamide formyltransferase/IMP cyclohydrolase [Holophagales bacterium]|jgi:phosphoribosylaminoimidazolecarboxamide formyltransferase/IMP cyclohydrolase|nr:bifunctional phosphoribosylaminoimidazolecarboxamide formyltransferase/IMP cyclohydrolase [Holophagales bacterium]